MKLSLRKKTVAHAPGLTGPVRMERRPADLARRLRPGDVALIDQVDLDRASAELLVGAQVAAVLNVSASCSGRYPNLGPEILANAGVLLVDRVGDQVFADLRDGQTVRVHEGVIHVDDREVGSGEVLGTAEVAVLMEGARAGLASQLDAFSASTAEFLKRESGLYLDGAGIPELTTTLAEREVVVVSRAYDWESDLALLRPYLKEYRPVLVGVDGGADALVEAGYRPDVVVCVPGNVSDATLTCGAEIVVHEPRDGGRDASNDLDRLGISGRSMPTTGTTEDAAYLLADHHDAALIVAVGSHASMRDFLDQGRIGMASTFLTRMKVGPRLVDATAVARMHRSRIGLWQLLLVLVAGLVALAVAIGVTPVGQEWADDLVSWSGDVRTWAEGLL